MNKQIIKKLLPNKIGALIEVFKKKKQYQILNEQYLEENSFLFSSKGISLFCDFRNKYSISSSPFIQFDYRLLSNNQDKVISIFICTEAIKVFAEKFVNKISTPFILFTGDSDLELSYQVFSEEMIEKVHSNKYLIRWYAQNLAIDLPKLSFLPIGLDFHSTIMRERTDTQRSKHLLEIQIGLIEVLKNSKQTFDRNLRCYSNWHFEKHRGNRNECFQSIDHRLCFFEPKRIEYLHTCFNQAKFMFVLSPEGNGMDCHRTYEAIILGSIPIIQSNAISKHFSDLPVIVVRSWNEVDDELLQQSINRFKERKFNFNPLLSSYWLSIKKNNNKDIIPRMTLKEFRSYLTDTLMPYLININIK